MQICIDAFNMITSNTGTYKTTKTININKRVRYMWCSCYRSKIEEHALMRGAEKIDGGRATITNSHFTEWVNENNTPNIYGLTSNNGSQVQMINTRQPKNINKYMPLTRCVSLRYIE